MQKIKKYFANDFFLVYQMGKVGSSAIDNTLTNSVNIHTLYGNHPCPFNHTLGYLGIKKWFKEHGGLITKRVIVKLRRETKIVCIYREPMTRNISMFMQDYCFWYAYAMQQNIINGKMENPKLPAKIFLEAFNHDYPYEWFDKELRKLTGIDIYDYAADLNNNGYSLISRKGFKVLIINYSKLNDVLADEKITSFFGKKIKLSQSNSAKDKWYSGLYKEIMVDKETYIKDFYKKFDNHKINKIM